MVPLFLLSTRFVEALLALSRSGYIGEDALVLHKIVPSSMRCWKRMLLETILCKFGQICATGNAFVRLIVGENSILNFPAKI